MVFIRHLLSFWALLMAQWVKNPPAVLETWVWSLGQEDLLLEGIAAHSSILDWRIQNGQRSLVGCNPCGCKEWDMAGD